MNELLLLIIAVCLLVSCTQTYCDVTTKPNYNAMYPEGYE